MNEINISHLNSVDFSENVEELLPKNEIDFQKQNDINFYETEKFVWQKPMDSKWISPILNNKTSSQEEDQDFLENEVDSDIDIINEEEVESNMINDDLDSILSLSISSVISQQSNLSLLREQYLQAHLSKQKTPQVFEFKYFNINNENNDVSDNDDTDPCQQ